MVVVRTATLELHYTAPPDVAEPTGSSGRLPAVRTGSRPAMCWSIHLQAKGQICGTVHRVERPKALDGKTTGTGLATARTTPRPSLAAIGVGKITTTPGYAGGPRAQCSG